MNRRLTTVMDDRAALAGFSQVRVAMVLTDPRAMDNPIVYVNAAFEKTTGYDRSAVIGRNCRFLQGEMTDKAAVDKLRRAVEKGIDTAVDIINYRANGEPFTNRLLIAPIADPSGEVIYYLGIQKELRDDERERTEFDTLVQTVRGRIAEDLVMLLDGIQHPETEHPFQFTSMHRRLEVLDLVYQSIKLSDAQDAADPRHAGAIDLGSLVGRVGVGIAHEECLPGVRYIQEIESIEVNLEAAIRMSLLVSEVLSNAFAHAFDRIDQGFVELRLARLAAGGLRIVVTDDGVGLPPNIAYPNPETVDGRLIAMLVDGLEATLTPVRGAAGTVVMIDVPAGVTEI